MKYQLLMMGVVVGLLTACTTTQPNYQKPIVTKNAKGVPSHYLVQQGDTVGRIAQRYGLNWREVARINRLDDNHTIYAGQWLLLWQGSHQQRNQQHTAVRVQSPSTQALSVPTPNRVTIVQNPPIKVQAVKTPSQNQSTQNTLTKTNVISDAGQFVYPVNKKSATIVSERKFGTVRQINGVNVKTEGVWFSAKEGDPINASRAGTVIYADVNSIPDASVVIRHADGFVSEYRFIKDAVVQAGQNVQAGQHIASMKSTNGVVVMEFRVAKNHVYLDPMNILK